MHAIFWIKQKFYKTILKQCFAIENATEIHYSGNGRRANMMMDFYTN